MLQNQLEGAIPASLADAPSLALLDVTNNSLAGASILTLAPCSSQLSCECTVHAHWLGVRAGCRFVPSLPLPIAKCEPFLPPAGSLPTFTSPSLQVLYLAFNNFSGAVPENLGAHPTLRTLVSAATVLLGTHVALDLHHAVAWDYTLGTSYGTCPTLHPVNACTLTWAPSRSFACRTLRTAPLPRSPLNCPLSSTVSCAIPCTCACLQDLENNTLTQLPSAWTSQPTDDVTAPLRFLRWVLAATDYQVAAYIECTVLRAPHTIASCKCFPKMFLHLCRLASNQLGGGFPAGLAAFPNLTFLLLANNELRLVYVAGGSVGKGS